MKKTVIEIVNEKLIEKLKQGVNPWRKTWKECVGGNYLNTAINYITNQPYKGVNRALLEPGYYVTYRQAQELGGYVKKGAIGNVVCYFNVIQKEVKDKTTEKKEIEQYFILKYYLVFNLEDTEGCRIIQGREVEKLPEATSIEEVDEIVQNYVKRGKLTLKITESNKAFYQPLFHKVVVPHSSQYENISEYYATLFHELGHSTGHKDLLDRDFNGTYGTDPYAKEELIAEIASAYMLSHLNLAKEQTTENSVAYLKNWAERLKGNTANYFIINATKQAEKAYQLIANINE